MFLQPAPIGTRPVMAIIEMAGRRRAPLPRHLRGAILCLGNFDGLHRGHRSLLAEAEELARKNGRPLAVMSCEPHPRSFFAPADHRPFRLASPVQKHIRLSDTPVSYLFEPRFDASFAGLSPQQFLKSVLVDHLDVSGVVCGSDFSFGAGRKGNIDTIHAFCSDNGLMSRAVTKSIPASSTGVREALMDRDFAAVKGQLGCDWQIDLLANGLQIRPPAGRYLARTIRNDEVELRIAQDGACDAEPARRGRFLDLIASL